MTNQEFLGEFLSLQAEAQSQVVSSIAFLKQKYIYDEPVSSSLNIALSVAIRKPNNALERTNSYDFDRAKDIYCRSIQPLALTFHNTELFVV
jgi:hypothetical protein